MQVFFCRHIEIKTKTFPFRDGYDNNYRGLLMCNENAGDDCQSNFNPRLEQFCSRIENMPGFQAMIFT